MSRNIYAYIQLYKYTKTLAYILIHFTKHTIFLFCKIHIKKLSFNSL